MRKSIWCFDDNCECVDCQKEREALEQIKQQDKQNEKPSE